MYICRSVQIESIFQGTTFVTQINEYFFALERKKKYVKKLMPPYKECACNSD